jgi:hypothetical protein
MGNILDDSKNFEDQQPISRNGAENRLWAVISREQEFSTQTSEMTKANPIF